MVIKKEFKNVSFIFSVIILLGLSIFVVWPILYPVIIGLLFAYLLNPIYKKMLTKIKSKNLCAFLIVFVIIVVVAIPIWFLIPIMIKQAFNIYLYIQKIDILKLITTLFPSLANTQFSTDIVLSINKLIVSTANKFFNNFSQFLFNLPLFFLKITVCLFVLFFSLRDEEQIKNFIKNISPFPPTIEKEFFKNFNDITKAVLYGFIVIGTLQGLLTGLGLFIFRVPQTIFLTFIAIIAGIIPVIGAWIVWIPASIYLFMIGKISYGIGLFLYGAIVVSWVDNLLRPYFVSRRSNISTALIFVGMSGGLITLGLIGLIIGPLVLSYLLVLLNYYKEIQNET